MNVLIVEDDPKRVKAFRQNLIGCSITHTNDSQEAVTLLMGRDFDVVFLDFDLHEHGPCQVQGDHVVWKAMKCPQCKAGKLWVVHSLNPLGHAKMIKHLRESKVPCWSWQFAWQDEQLKDKIEAKLPAVRV